MKIRYNTNKFDRDPSIYLGIDGRVIPWSYFKGVFTDDNTIIFTDDPYSGIQFYASQDGKGCGIVTNNSNQYVTKEDLENDYWLLIGHALMEITQPWITQFLDTAYTEAQTKLHRKYNNGETGLLKVETKKFNDKGEYMISKVEFDTRPAPEEKDIRGTLLNHINFVYWDDPVTPAMERKTIIRSNVKNLNKISALFNEEFKNIHDLGYEMYYKKLLQPPFGAMEFVEDNLVETFIVTKK